MHARTTFHNSQFIICTQGQRAITAKTKNKNPLHLQITISAIIPLIRKFLKLIEIIYLFIFLRK